VYATEVNDTEICDTKKEVVKKNNASHSLRRCNIEKNLTNIKHPV